jgi:REP element-mobilizing transposase RayT
MPDRAHVTLAIPPKHAVSHAMGLIKGESASDLARVYGECKRHFMG